MIVNARNIEVIKFTRKILIKIALFDGSKYKFLMRGFQNEPICLCISQDIFSFKVQETMDFLGGNFPFTRLILDTFHAVPVRNVLFEFFFGIFLLYKL